MLSTRYYSVVSNAVLLYVTMRAFHVAFRFEPINGFPIMVPGKSTSRISNSAPTTVNTAKIQHFVIYFYENSAQNKKK